MTADDNQSRTRTALPSPVDLTRTSEPRPTSSDDDGATHERHPTASAQLRDPERYEMIAEHGRGGLGRVSRAHDHELGRDIAIKELISRDHLSEVRFLREALITARLEHPGIVPIYEAGRWPDGTPFYAMKLVSGRSLRQLIAERTTVEQRIGLLHHVIAVADAIAYAHGRNIIHRDLKPANVIVGEFGETIVIDWGLAKDLSTSEDSGIRGGPPSSPHDSDLTAAGSILGTPAYMAPEQERGEPVDQRADVFAIGAMLWELCALKRVPPTERSHRHRMLRHAGIDRDLIAIIDKALDPDPAGRYPDAGALAADLKAFKAGARIAARSYSLLAMLVHWTRRHRALALSIVAAVAVAAASSMLYVRNIAAERDRAEASNNGLILEHAMLLLRSDPTAAFDLLDTYTGSDPQRLALLRAQAQGLGLSRARLRPHTRQIFFARTLADGTLITFDADGTVARTLVLGPTTSSTRTIARGATPQPTVDYAEARHLLAYACDATAICLLDVQSEQPRQPPSSGSPLAPAALAFSPSGDQLAAISAHGETSVWQLRGEGPPVLVHQHVFAGGGAMQFVDEHTLVAQSADRIQIIHLSTPDPQRGEVTELMVPGASNLSVSGPLQLAAVGTGAGLLEIIDTRTGQITARESICKGYVNAVHVLSGRSAIAYACEDGDAGIWDLALRARSVVGYAEGGVVALASTSDGRFLLAGSKTGKLLAYDFSTRLLSTYLGHGIRIAVLLPPAPGFPSIVSADVTGTVRTWPLPEPPARVAITTTAPMSRAVLLPGNGPLIATIEDGAIPWVRRDGTTGSLSGHNPQHFFFTMSATHPRFAMYGIDDEVELWSFEPRAQNRRLNTRHAATAAVFTTDDAHLVVGSRDGTLTEWSLDDDSHHDLGTVREPILLLRDLPNSATVVAGTASGAVWLADAAGLRQIGKEAAAIMLAARSSDARWLAVATSQGVVRLYDLVTHQASTILHTASWVDFVTFSPDNKELVIATDERMVAVATAAPLAPRAEAVAGEPALRWREVGLAARFGAFSPDNKWFAITCDHGDIWFYRRHDDRWLYLPTGATNVSFGRFSDDGAYFTASDASGRALLIDMHADPFR
ncbi:MAG TPA: WD40 repeat domain-containing serine/threonine-protein kinase [Kofleriaceae bacterium]|nr:WD40 repeat domain-containing serine/threonine-protein kinase [Kofleriaceae bacterium]